MSNLLFMDESNGNGVYATKFNGTSTAATNNITNMMSATTTTAAVVPTTLPNSLSSEDLSQSLSEYTDADESISAPTEFLAEFLSAVMLKDYKKALKYCKLILHYEPNNATAKEFYPLILDKLRGEYRTYKTVHNIHNKRSIKHAAKFYAVASHSSDSDENCNKSSSPELVLELPFMDPLGGDSDEAAYDNQNQQQQQQVQQQQQQIDDDLHDCLDEYGMPIGNYSGEINNHDSLVCCISSSSESLSVSVDDNEDEEDDDVEDDEDEEDEDEDDEDEDEINSSCSDLPNGVQHLLDVGVARHGIAGNNSNSSSGAEGRSGSDNTTHSYSSLLLEEEEDDIVAVNLQFSKDLAMSDLDVSNGNKLPSASCSDSESPTEPLTQRLAAILRSKCGVGGNADN